MAEQLDAVALPLLPVPGGVVVPGMVVTIALESAEAIAAVDAAADADGRLVLVPKLQDRYASVGTVATVEQSDRLPGGRRGILVRGLARARIGTGLSGSGEATWVHIDPVQDDALQTDELHQLATEYRAVVEAILVKRGAARQIANAITELDDPGQLADTAVYSPDLDVAQKVQVLETLDVTERLRTVLGWARDLLAELDVTQRIQSEVNESMEARQREFLLRQQMEAIRKELGETDEGTDDYRTRAAELPLPEGVRAEVLKEIDRLERTSEQSPEQSWIRTWLDRIFDLPWGQETEDRLDLDEARAILDADHTGLDDVKDRLVEQLAVRKLRRERGMDAAEEAEQGGGRSARASGAILALVGPPGVGKTSMGESVARALGRKFVRVALGGVRDEAEIRGHRRTYVGAQPGRIARAITEAGTMNPVMLLDEVDKVGGDWRGDPSAALLEVLDPAQNHTFRDHYMEIDLDLSDVLFLATANVLETIPGPLLDRMEVVRLDGYTDDEKVTIAREHLLGRQLSRNGLRPDELDLSDEILRKVVEGWTREAGVRQLERQIGKLARKAATAIAGGTATPIVVEDPADYLGRQKIFPEVAERTTVPGVATGLAVTGAGGDVLFVEAAAMDGKPGLKLTGQLGDVMQESASIALTYLCAHATELALDGDALANRHFHVHFPAGAIPKDGPSAGVTMTTALASLVSGRRVKSGVGMTGEVTLQGKVLPIGGVKQKVLAAHRAGLAEVILPERNGPDLDDVPDKVLADLTVHLVSDAAQVLELALEPAEASGETE